MFELMFHGKKLYTLNAEILSNENLSKIYFGLFNNKEDTSWIINDVKNNFESFSIVDDSFVFKTKDNAFLFQIDFIDKLPKIKISTGILILNESKEVVPLDYKGINFNNQFR